MPTTDIKTLEKVQKLIKLAASDNEEEARTAAVQATALMREHELVLVPRAEIERVEKIVEGARQLAVSQKQEGIQKMLIGGLAGLVLAKQLKF
jgi:Protein of unknown function (DUF2786)